MSQERLIWRFADGGPWDLSSRTHILGILNVTPDSFSDGGKWLDPGRAVARGLEMAGEGADAIDVGGESTRPGAAPVPEEEEAKRVLPVVKALRDQLDARYNWVSSSPGGLDENVDTGKAAATETDALGGRLSIDTSKAAVATAATDARRVRISIDTSKAAVAAAALDAGADIVNDVTALRGDPEMARIVAERSAAVVLMHMRGVPATMQAAPRYADLMGEIAEELRAAELHARKAGVGDDRIIFDPGIGFGKTARHNLSILERLPLLLPLGRPILIGVSRKSFLGAISGSPVRRAGLTGGPGDERLEASLAAGAVAIVRGASVLRVHDVAASVRMARTVDAILGAGRTDG